MKIEVLSKFASEDPERKNVCRPWSRGEHSYATNGWVLVRVPRIEGVEENDAAPDADQLFPPLPPTRDLFDHAEQLPICDEPKRHACSRCNGAKNIETCPECNGDYPFEVDSGSNLYEVECKTCDGDGTVPSSEGKTCDLCDGTGLGRYEKNFISVGEQHFNQFILWSMGTLPRVWIHPRKFRSIDASYFTFDGGDGLVVPMRRS
jgi:hypothetical protein